MIKIALTFVSAIVLSSISFAEETNSSASVWAVSEESAFYVGLGIAAMSARDAGVSLDYFDPKPGEQDRLGNLTLLAGYDFNDYIAVEGRYTTSIVDEDEVKMSGWSLFVKPQYAFKESETNEKNGYKIYALLGFGGVSMDGVNGYYADVDNTGFQWGIGASYSLIKTANHKDLSIFIDYTSLANNMDGAYPNGASQVDADAITLGLTYRFGL